MKIRRVEVKNFRGIQELDWICDGSFICLIGPGDSTKSTILDAVELALSPRWNLQFDDTDFYGSVTATPIRILVTISELDDNLISDGKFGLETRGWSADGQLRDEPEDGDELALTIQLMVDASLEPTWKVVNDRHPEGKAISALDREKLGCGRLGDFLDRHFAWGKGSSLSKLTSGSDGLSKILAEASRAARAAVIQAAPEGLQPLQEAAQKALEAGATFGMKGNDFRPHLDLNASHIGVGALSLHDGNVPVRRAGLGSRRLLSLGMQYEVAHDAGIILIDEIEYGLEPHRLRGLLRTVRSHEEGSAHVFMTTHSPIALGELQASELRVVRSREGVTSVLKVPTNLQNIVRKTSEAFLARKVIVCEGSTEIGLCRRLDSFWSEEGSFALIGVALANGGGTEAPKIAMAFAEMGYSTALLLDSDSHLTPAPEQLEQAGIMVFQWADATCLEQRLLLDLPWNAVVAFLNQAVQRQSLESIRNSVAARLGVRPNQLPENIELWNQQGLENAALRMAIGKVASEKEWFKRVDLAEELLGQHVINNWAALLQTDFGLKISALKQWAYENA